MNALTSTTIGPLIPPAVQAVPDVECPILDDPEQLAAAARQFEEQMEFLELLTWLDEQNLEQQMLVNNLWAEFTRYSNWEDAKHNIIMGIIGISGLDLGPDALDPADAQAQSDNSLALSIGSPTVDLSALFGIFPDT
jgi:hypothetical protein